MSQANNSSQHYHFAWQLNWKILLFSAIFLPLTLLAGQWQLNRADEKREIADDYYGKQVAKPIAAEELAALVDPSWVRVELTGHYSRNSFLLDNRVQQGKVGYEVLTPFVTDSNQWFLINRGWVQGNALRTELPEISTPTQTVTLMGTVYTLPDKYRVVEEQLPTEWPIVIQSYNFELIQQRIGHTLAAPLAIRLDDLQRGGYDIDWQVINIQPEKHTAYAVQWFGMAVALVILTLLSNSNLPEWFRQRKNS